jgi:hypothetical protein
MVMVAGERLSSGYRGAFSFVAPGAMFHIGTLPS